MLVEDIKIIKKFYVSGNPILNNEDRFVKKKQGLRLFIKLAKREIQNYKFLHKIK